MAVVLGAGTVAGSHSVYVYTGYAAVVKDPTCSVCGGTSIGKARYLQGGIECSRCGRTAVWGPPTSNNCVCHPDWKSSCIQEYANKNWGGCNSNRVQCSNCKGKGSITTNKNCTHGKGATHWHCEHGNNFTTNYHADL